MAVFLLCRKGDDYIKKIYGVIYCITNIINNKKYIGQTIRDLSIRKREHIGQSNNGSDLAIHQAIRKYGENNFEWSIIDQAYSQEDLDNKEIYWIDYYDSYYDGGYNMAKGGQFNLSDCPDEMSEMRGGKPFLVYDMDGNFIKETISQTTFADEIGVCVGTVNNVLKEIKSSTCGYILIFKDDFSEEKLNYKIGKSKNREFYVFDKSTLGFIGRWDNREMCQNELDVSRHTITRSLDYDNKNSRNKYLFYYKNDIPYEIKYKLEGVI